jgi:hypothetical protein
VLAILALILVACPAGDIEGTPGSNAGESMQPTAASSPEGPTGAEVAGSSQRFTHHPAGLADAPLGYYEYLPAGYGDGEPRPLLVSCTATAGAATAPGRNSAICWRPGSQLSFRAMPGREIVHSWCSLRSTIFLETKAHTHRVTRRHTAAPAG